jgi:hypothetical protein
MKFCAGVLGEALHGIVEFGAPAIVRAIVVVEADDLEPLVEQLAAGEVVDRGHEEAFGQVAGRAEDDDRAWRSRLGADHPPFFHPNVPA